MNGDQSANGRDAHGRLLPGHRFGGRPKGRRAASPLAKTLAAMGIDVAEARRVLVEQTLAQAKAGDMTAIRLLASWVLPRERALDPGLLRGVQSPEQAQAAVLGAVGAGALSPAEGVNVSRVVEKYAEAGPWERLREKVEGLDAEGPALPAGPDDGQSNDR